MRDIVSRIPQLFSSTGLKIKAIKDPDIIPLTLQIWENEI